MHGDYIEPTQSLWALGLFVTLCAE